MSFGLSRKGDKGWKVLVRHNLTESLGGQETETEILASLHHKWRLSVFPIGTQ